MGVQVLQTTISHFGFTVFNKCVTRKKRRVLCVSPGGLPSAKDHPDNGPVMFRTVTQISSNDLQMEFGNS